MTTPSPLPAPLRCWDRGQAGGSLLPAPFHSGDPYGTYANRVQSLNVSTGHWGALPPLPSRRRGHWPLCSGRPLVRRRHVAVERWWLSAPGMPREVWYAAAVAFEGKLLVTGGSDKAFECLSAVLGYNPGDGSWKELPGLLTARYNCAVTVLEGDVVVVGGRQASGFAFGRTQSVERGNCRLQCWGAMPSLPGQPLRIWPPPRHLRH